jgi:hypothetical protein
LFCFFVFVLVFFGGDVEYITRAQQLEQSWLVFCWSQNFCTPAKTTKTQKNLTRDWRQARMQAHKRSDPGSTQNVFALQKWMRLAWGEWEGAWRGLNQQSWMIFLDENRWTFWMWRCLTSNGTPQKKRELMDGWIDGWVCDDWLSCRCLDFFA